jgi:hypothetical protein
MILDFIHRFPNMFDSYQVDNLGTSDGELPADATFTTKELRAYSSWYTSAIIQCNPGSLPERMLLSLITELFCRCRGY